MRESERNPFLRGNFAPWRLEGVALDLEVTGELPRDLAGTFYRNGPNPAFEPLGPYHWFDGDGMIHALQIADGRAAYRNRWVQSAGLLEERRAGKALFPGLLALASGEGAGFKNTANTNIVWHAGKLLALIEAALPTRLAPDDLSTIGEHAFDGRLSGAMTAHPKMDPETGEMLFFGYAPFPPYLTYHVVDRHGGLLRSVPIDLPWPSMIHDFAVTRDEVIFILCPLLFSFENIPQRGGVFSWEPERGTRLGVMPRGGAAADVRWFETGPSYVFHSLNAYRSGDKIVLDVARYPRLLFMSPSQARADDAPDGARLHRWHLDLTAGSVRDEPLDDCQGEFPRLDERRAGLRHRYGYVALRVPGEPNAGAELLTGIRRYDLDGGRTQTRCFGAGNGTGEPLFIPRRPESAEDDGYVVSLVYDAARDASDFYVLDAADITSEPVAVVHLPHRVPYGFHGNWVAA